MQEIENLLKGESHTVNKIKKKIENLNFYKIPREVFFTCEEYAYPIEKQELYSISYQQRINNAEN